MDNITVKCEKCGAVFTLPASMRGRTGRCACGNPIVVGESPGEAQVRQDEEAAAFADMWYYAEKGETRGPLRLEELREKIRAGQIGPAHMVFNSALGAWTRASQVRELESDFRVARETEGGWYVAVKGQTYGPYTEQMMRDLIAEGRIRADSLVWAESLQGWKQLQEAEPFAAVLVEAAAAEAQRQEVPEEAEAAVEEMWYYLHRGEKVGPCSLDQIIRAAREGKLSAKDRVWSNRLDGWRSAEEVDEFAEALRQAEAAREGSLWYCQTGVEVRGPLSLPELRRLVETGSVTVGDRVYSKALGTWKDIRQVPQLEDALGRAQAGLAQADARAEVWYFMEGGKERGPVSERLLSEMVAGKKLGGEDLVWGPGVEQWQPIAKVPQFARLLGRRRAVPPPLKGSAVSGRTAMMRRKPRLRSVLLWVGPGVVVVAVVLIVAALFGGGGGPEEPEGPSAVGRGGPEAVVAEWLQMFLRDESSMTRAETQALAEGMKRFYLNGYLDIYSEDMRQVLGRAWRQRARRPLLVTETECDAMRCEDRQHFCYHASFSANSVSVQAPVPSGIGGEFTLVQKTFFAGDFQRLRRFLVSVDGAAKARVLAVGEGDELKVVAFGRAANIGAAAAGKRVIYLVGYKSTDASERDALIRVGTGEAMGGEGESWERFGQLMGLDSLLVPRSVRRARQRILREGFSGGQVLIFGRSAVALDEVGRAYGPPRRQEVIELPDSRFTTVAGPEGPLYTRLSVHYYGGFGIATEPGSAAIVAVLFPAPRLSSD